jgi:hypothetical protein
MAPGAALRKLAEGKPPAAEAALFGVATERQMRGIDLDADGRMDILVSGKDEQSTWRVQFFVRR